MNDEEKCEQLLDKLDKEILRLQRFSPEKVPGLTEIPRSVGFMLTNDTKIEEIPDDKISLVHSMLHLFYSNKSGAKLSKKHIKRLHKDVSKKMNNHLKFDKLDI
jgi:flagellar basal body-associated protein FliL